MKASHASAEQRLNRRDEYLAGQFFVVDLISEKSAFRTHGIVLNMSNGGMAVQTFCPLIKGQVAEIHLAFPKVSSISMGTGLVAWEKQGGLAGIRFLNPPLKNLPELRQLVLRNFSPTDSESAPPLFACRNSNASELDTTLHLLACDAMALTGATGAAIAIGNSSGMECRASVGNAPDVGARLQPDNGLSGHSLRTGAVNICDDAWADPRVNAAAARQMDARSIVIVPITMSENVVGLLEAFSGDTNHFDERHVHRLLPIVNVLAAVPELETVPLGSDATSYEEVAMPEEPAIVAAYSRFANRSRVIAIAIGIMAALLALIAGIAWFGSRVRAKSLGNTKFSISTQNDARQPGASVAGETLSNAKPAIGFNPSVIDQKVGATFDVDVVLKGAKDVLSVPVQIAYDPEKLLLITVTNGGLLDRDGQAAALVQRAEPSDGHIDVSISRPSFAPGISGDGAVFTLKFIGKAPGRSRLRVNQTGLRDTSAEILSVDSSEAIVTISKFVTPPNNAGGQGAADASSHEVAPECGRCES